MASAGPSWENGNYIYVWSGGWTEQWASNVARNSSGINYFALSAVTMIQGTSLAWAISTPGLTVRQAYSIDSKVDDGYPQSGGVLAMYPTLQAAAMKPGGRQAVEAQKEPFPGTRIMLPLQLNGATPVSDTTCYANGNVKWRSAIPPSPQPGPRTSTAPCLLSFSRVARQWRAIPASSANRSRETVRQIIAVPSPWKPRIHLHFHLHSDFRRCPHPRRETYRNHHPLGFGSLGNCLRFMLIQI